ncbi:hypothetical protein K474DRAFT_1678943 [Panus rudis PR-1116 ss-1]|nr:hypothetical protein K474DRAFT_1678943 [Panus rudis PR-1116 ss-1]
MNHYNIGQAAYTDDTDDVVIAPSRTPPLVLSEAVAELLLNDKAPEAGPPGIYDPENGILFWVYGYICSDGWLRSWAAFNDMPSDIIATINDIQYWEDEFFASHQMTYLPTMKVFYVATNISVDEIKLADSKELVDALTNKLNQGLPDELTTHGLSIPASWICVAKD